MSVPAPFKSHFLVSAFWNHADLSARFLDSFYANSRHPWRLIVVDNGSTDSTFQLLNAWQTKLSTRLIVLRNSQNEGCARAWNRGIKAALAEGAELVGILNNDLVLPPGWDDELLRHAQTQPHSLVFSPHVERKLPLSVFSVRAAKFMKRNAERTRPECNTDAIFIRSEVFDKVGLFDEDFFVSFEDFDFLLRLKQQNIGTLAIGGSYVWHQPKSSRLDLPGHHEIDGRKIFISKWGEAAEFDRVLRQPRRWTRWRKFKDKLGFF